MCYYLYKTWSYFLMDNNYLFKHLQILLVVVHSHFCLHFWFIRQLYVYILFSQLIWISMLFWNTETSSYLDSPPFFPVVTFFWSFFKDSHLIFCVFFLLSVSLITCFFSQWFPSQLGYWIKICNWSSPCRVEQFDLS